MYAEANTQDQENEFKQELRNLLIQEAIKLKKVINNLNDPEHPTPVKTANEGFQSCLKLFEIFANRLDLL